MIDYVPERKGKYDDENTWIGELIGASDLFAENNRLSKKQKTQFQNAIIARFGSNKGKLYERDTKTLKSRKEYGTTRASKYTTTSNDIDEVLKVAGELTNEIDKAEINTLKWHRNKSQNDLDYEKERKGTTEGEAFNEQNEAKKGKAEFQASAKKAIDKAINELEPYVKEGSITAMVMQSALPALYLKFIKE